MLSEVLNWIQSAGEWILGAGALVAVLARLTRRTRAKLGERIGHLDQIPPLVEKVGHHDAILDKLSKGLAEIGEELKINGGSTLKDIVARQEARRLAFFDAETDLIFETASDGKLYWANRALLHMLGATLSDVRGHGWLRYVADECEHASTEWHSAVTEGRTFREDLVLVTASGDRFRVAASGIPMRLARDGATVIGHLVTLRPGMRQSGPCPAAERCPAMGTA